MHRLNAFEKMRINRLRAGTLSRKLAILEEMALRIPVLKEA